jgi:uncharacterized membrane protein YphA (DoxX/SURF4 family)
MNHVVMLDPAAGSLLVGCYLLLFASAAAHKLRDLRQFADVFAGYGLVPALLRWRLAWLVPVVEILVALGLLLPASRAIAALVAAALLLTYAIAISINLRAGRDLVACGCGGPDQRPIARWMVWRNLLLALGLGLATLPWRARTLEWTDGATLAFGLTSIALLYACAERLLGDLGRARDSGTPTTS